MSQEQPTPTDKQPDHPLRRTRTDAALNGFVGGAVVLILLIVFILQNTEQVKINYMFWGGRIALGIALLIAAVAGGLIGGALGMARTRQLRRRARRGLQQR